MGFLRLAVLGGAVLCAAQDLPRNVHFYTGAANSVLIGENTAVYGVPPRARRVTRLLLTHARRDIVHDVPPRVSIVVPAGERDLFADPLQFWTALETARFHDYAQQGTKVPVEP